MKKLMFVSLIILILFMQQVFVEANAYYPSQLQKDGGENIHEGLMKKHKHHKINCNHACARRCSKSSRKKICHRACKTCCAHCHCVPPGTYGNKQLCPCYANLKTHGNKPKCP